MPFILVKVECIEGGGGVLSQAWGKGVGLHLESIKDLLLQTSFRIGFVLVYGLEFATVTVLISITKCR